MRCLRSHLSPLLLLPVGLACGADTVRWISSSALESIVLVDEIQGSSRPRVTLYHGLDEVYVEPLSPGTHSLFSLGFRQLLANLAVPLELDELGVELPPPDEVRELLVGAEVASPWRKIAEPPTRIAALKFKASIKVTSESSELLTQLSSSTPHQAGLVDPSGQIWLLGEQGAVVRGLSAAAPAPATDPQRGAQTPS